MGIYTKELAMPDGMLYEFYGRTYFGTCRTAAATQIKTVTIVGGCDNVSGTRINVLFTYAQNSSLQPYLQVGSNTALPILRRNGEAAGQYEWDAGTVVTFMTNGNYWIIENGGTASTTYYGRTKLSDTIANDSTKALTPKAVYDAGYLTTETDPTVPAWAKAASKPTYTAAEVGAVPTSRTVNGKALSSNITLTASDVSALPSSTSIPTKVSDLQNDSGFLTLATLPIYDGSVT